MKFKIGVLIFSVLFALSSAAAFANTVPPYTPEKVYWVDGTNGLNTNSGLTATLAFKTLTYATTPANLASLAGTSNGNWGHIIMVKPGTYTGAIDINGANLKNLTIMSTSTSPDSVIISTTVAATPTVKINEDNVKISGVTFKSMALQTAAFVLVDGSAGAGGGTGVNYLLYNCVFDDVLAGMTTGAVNITLGAALAQTNDANIENCTFDLALGTAPGVLIGGGFLNTHTVIKNSTFNGISTLTSLAVSVVTAAKFQNLYVTGCVLNYTPITVVTHSATLNSNDGLYILGNFFNLTDGVTLTSGAAVAQFGTNGVKIIGNHFKLDDGVTGRANAFALNISAGNATEFPQALMFFNFNNIEVKQLGAEPAQVRTAVRAAAFPTTATDSNWWKSAAADGRPDAGGAAANGGAYLDVAANHFSAPTVHWTANNVPIGDNSSGVQFFDIDKNGHLDKAVINMSKRINPSTVPNAAVANKDGLNIGSGYVITKATVEAGTTTTCQSIAVYFTEQYAFDTSVLPQVTYTSANDAAPKLASLSAKTDEQVATWTEFEAVEVDKAEPVLIKAQTADAGYGTGTAGNGFLDAIQFTFSEPVQGVRAEAGLWDAGSLWGAGSDVAVGLDSTFVVKTGDISFNQGSGNKTPDTSVYTLAVREIRLNTGLTPVVVYRHGGQETSVATTVDVVSDFAVSATGAQAWNVMHDAGMASFNELLINVLDNAALVAASVKTADTGPNGRIDQITVTFSEPVDLSFNNGTKVAFYTTVPNFGTDPTTLPGYYTIGTGGSAPVPTGSVITFTLVENATATAPYDTEALPEFRYTPNSTAGQKIMDLAGVQLATYGSNVSGGKVLTTADGASPVLLTVTTKDAYIDSSYAGALALVGSGPDGRIDTVTLRFSEATITGNSAQISGATTALNSAIAQFTLTHPLAGAGVRTLVTTAANYGKPTWSNTDVSGDTTSEINISFEEVSYGLAALTNNGDTGSKIAAAYSGSSTALDNIKDAAENLIATAGAVTVDGAAPFLVQGTGKGWGSNAFTNVKTVDSDGFILNGGGGDTANGNGFIDGFLLEFTETVKINTLVAAGTVTAVDSLGCFTTTLSKGGTLLFSVGKGKISVNTATAASEITLTGLASETPGAWNTEITPTLVYAPSATLGTVYDAVTVTATQPVNVMAGCSRVASDGARPVIVNLLQNGSVATELEVTFSESVWGHYPAALTRNALIDSLQIASSVLFKYEDTKAGGATTASATYIRKKTDNQWIVTLDAALTADDISTSSFWCKENSYIYDDANANDSGILDNDLKGLLAGTNLKIMIMDDVVKPFINSITTVDANGNGYIDHLRIGLNEAVKDTTIGGYVRQNTLSTDVAAKYIITGYTGGTVLFNFFAPDNAGKDAAIAAGEPVFSDNLLDDAVLYIKLEESKITKYAGTNLGSTNYTGTMSLSSPTLIDKSARANVLDTTFGTVAAAAKGKIVDAVAPVLMSAEWANSKVNLSFSEAVEDTGAILKDVQFSIMDTYLYGYTFTPSTGAAASSWAINAAVLPTVTAETANFRKKIDNILWKDKGRIELTMRSGWAWPADKALGIQLASFDLGPGTLCVFKDAAVAADGTTSAVNAAVLYGADPKGTATWYAAGDKAHPWPYDTVPQYDYVGLKLITGIPSIKMTAPGDINAMVGQSVDVKWSSTNIDSVDVWVSKNLGISFAKIAGSRTVATAAKYVWTVSSGANYVQISSMADSAVCSKSGLITIISGGEDVVTTTEPVGAPSNLVLTDVPNDNGHWMFATFTKSADHLTRVKSYQFYREVDFGTTAAPDLKWVYSAVVPAGVVDVNNKQTVLVPSIVNGVARWAVVASTGDVVTDLSVAAKEAGIAVAMLVDAAEKAAAEVVLSAMSATAEGGAIDNIAPSAIVTFAADDNEGAGTGVKLSWTAPEDHGIVGYYGWAGVGTFPIYGVDEYQVYRKEKGAAEFALVGAATPLSTSYVDAVSDGATIYQYMIKAVDSAHAVETTTKMAIASVGGADFTSDGVVGLGDLVLFGNQWNLKSTDANWVSSFDLNADGTVGLGDLVLLGNAWTVAGKVAKEALPLTSDVALTMSANYDGTSSIYYVNIAANKVDGFNGVGFTMSYDADALELVKDGITGLGAVSITREAEAGMVDVNSYFMDKEFTGTVTVAFKSKGMSKNFDFELVNASVSIDNVVSAVSKLASITVEAVPTVYSISQNFPNPFNPTTTIEYSIPQAGNVELVIYNMAGQKVRTLVNENQPAAYTKVVWDGRNDMGETVGAGMYFYKLVSGNFSKIQKMTLIK